MSDAGFDLHILILSEDSGGGGRPLRALTRSMHDKYNHELASGPPSTQAPR